MPFKKEQFNNICYWPSNPKKIIEFIGGSYLATKPDITYKRFIEGLLKKNYAVHAHQYIPQFDHQELALQAWKDFKRCKTKLDKRIGSNLKTIRIGHSLGCKLHLLSPDGGRNCENFVSISFNNFGANKSIPLLKRVSEKLNFKSEFSPSPEKTLQMIQSSYIQNKNLLIKFNSDNLDQTESLLTYLKARKGDNSVTIRLDGNHTLLASSGFREDFLGKWADDHQKRRSISKIIDFIDTFN